jgi:hypothetical protein
MPCKLRARIVARADAASKRSIAMPEQKTVACGLAWLVHEIAQE